MGNAPPPDVRHTMPGSLARAGHVGARIPEAQVKVLFAGPAVTLVGLLDKGVGRAYPQTKGWFDTKTLKLHGCAPIRQAYPEVLWATVGRNPTWAGPLVVEKPYENCSEGWISPLGGLDDGECPPPLMSDTQCHDTWPEQAMWGPGFQKHRSRCCLLALLSPSWIRGGESLAPNNGIV